LSKPKLIKSCRAEEEEEEEEVIAEYFPGSECLSKPSRFYRHYQKHQDFCHGKL
jgi:hypothetical protein